MMDIFDRMLLDNRAWAQEMVELSPAYFRRLSKVQTPEVLWLGCSDSRAPAEIVLNADPGEMFVHRNIANQLLDVDINARSVLQYAVEVLNVGHIVVCGHYNCGGVLAALAEPDPQLPIVNDWLRNVRETISLHQDELSNIPDENLRNRRLVELNVLRQVSHLEESPIVQSAWSRRRSLVLHGCVYGVEDGLIKEMTRIHPR